MRRLRAPTATLSADDLAQLSMLMFAVLEKGMVGPLSQIQEIWPMMGGTGLEPVTIYV
jgi:hypothetical protein